VDEGGEVGGWRILVQVIDCEAVLAKGLDEREPEGLRGRGIEPDDRRVRVLEAQDEVLHREAHGE